MAKCDVCELPRELCVCDDIEEQSSRVSFDNQELIVGSLDETIGWSAIIWGFEESHGVDKNSVAEDVATEIVDEFEVTYEITDGRILLDELNSARVQSYLENSADYSVKSYLGVPHETPYGYLKTVDEESIAFEGKLWPREVTDRPPNSQSMPVASTNDPTWTFETTGTISSAPTVQDSVVYVGDHDCILYALQSTDGTLLWQQELSGEIISASPIVVDRTVYVTCYDDLGRGSENIYALDSDDGSIQWSSTTYRGSKSSPTYVDGLLIVAGTGGPSTPGPVRCLDAADGSEQWTTDIGPGRLAVANETVYMQAGRSLHALRLSDGSQRWTSEFRSHLQGGPVIHYGDVYVGTSKNDIHAVDGWTGEELWSTDIFVEEVHGDLRNAYGQTHHPMAFAGVSSLIAHDELIFAGTYNAVFAVDAERGGIHWAADLGCKGVYAQLVTDNRLYFGSGSGGVYALTPWDGSGGLVYEFDETAYPKVSQHGLYVAVKSGHIHGFCSH